MPFGTLDTEYYTTTPEQWAEIIQKVVISELYIDETRDCDWYALDALVIVQGKYNLNAFGYCQGNTPQGYHAWNILLTSDCDWWCFEPQSGYGYGLFPLGQNGYRPDKVLI